MPRVSKKRRTIARQLSAGDKKFIKYLASGEYTKTDAFKLSYPTDRTLVENLEIIRMYDEGEEEITYEDAYIAKKRIHNAAREKARSHHISTAFNTYKLRMDELADDGLDVIEEIMNNGRSEKVRADLAVEMVRHKVGSPTVKVASHEQKEVTITVGKPQSTDQLASDQVSNIIEGEVVEGE